MHSRISSAQIAIGKFQKVQPPYERSQENLVEWTTRCHEAATVAAAATHPSATAVTLDADNSAGSLIGKLFRRYSVSADKIAKRSFECSDLESIDGWRTNRIYRFENALPEGAPMKERMEFFSERATKIFDEFYPPQKNLPEHLIHVTCTGYVSPSAAQKRAAGTTHVGVTHAYHMGCYASLPAVRMGQALVSSAEDPAFTADVVHTEMCGLHMNASDHSPEQIVVQTLFADGHIKYSLKRKEHLETGFAILGIHEEIVPDSVADMAWVPSSWGMHMTLSREVPQKIAANLRPFLERLLTKANEDKTSILKSAIFAIHPGGPKIIESVRQTLELSVDQTRASEKILLEHGNMSSATLPHVWEEIQNSKPEPGTKIVSLAFGPGLTLFGAVFEYF